MASKFARSFCNRNNMGNNKANDNFIFSKNNEWIETNNKNGLDSIPKRICENIIQHMKYRWALCIKYKGRRLDKELLRKIPKIKKDFK